MEPVESKNINRNSRRLRIHLTVAVLLKLAALVLIWWFFFREEAVDINADFMASHLDIPAISQGVSK